MTPAAGPIALAALLPPQDSGRLGGLMQLLWRLAHAQRRQAIPALLAAIGLAALALLPPWLLSQMLDRAFPAQQASLATGLASGLLGAALLDAALAWLRRLLAAEAGLEARSALLLPAYAAMLRLPADDNLAGDHGVLSQTFAEVERLARVASEEAVELVLSLGTVVLLSGAMLFVETRLGLIVLILSLGLVLLHLVAGRRLRQREAIWFETRSRHWAHLVETIAYIETVRLNGAYAFAEARFATRLANDIDANRQVIRLAALLDGVGRLTSGLILAAIALVGGASVVRGQMSIGQFVLFLSIGGALAAPLLNLTKSLAEAQAVRHAHSRLAQLAEARHEAVGISSSVPPAPPSHARLQVDRVTFWHSGRQHPVLENFSCAIEPGERIALLGTSGVGKSTLASLLFRQRVPDGGKILLDGVSLDEIPLDILRRRILWVPHQIDIFTASIAENICIGQQHTTQTSLALAVDAACLSSDLRSFPEGLATQLGHGGIELSAGQRQRLGIARAILHKPQILILDESTSALDSSTEAEVINNLDQELPQTAIIAITHRESIAMRMDRRLVLGRQAD